MYLLIFCGEAIYASLTTLRLMFTRKGFHLASALVGLIEITLWVVVTGTVVKDVASEPMKAGVYCVAFGAGILLGTALEKWLAVGVSEITVITPEGDVERVVFELREYHYTVTTIAGCSIHDEPRQVIYVRLRNKDMHRVIRRIQQMSPGAIVSVSDLKELKTANRFHEQEE